VESGLTVGEDASTGAWMQPGLSGEVGSVTGTVPDRFDTYVRILHPAMTSDGKLAAWAKVAAELGKQMHARMQWHVLVDSPDPYTFTGSEWKGSPPEDGDNSTLVGGSAELIAAILADEEIEAWPIGPHDSLAIDGDVDG
jgi:hypothetical protein